MVEIALLRCWRVSYKHRTESTSYEMELGVAAEQEDNALRA